ncbi:MAG: hypothetical protein NC338_06830 [Firmicutes bacterium]|nr:hypothetical protein [Bacillota bacterium]MCM1402123.1 hypothetical protein [Bacteroides sp.]MCM1478024.1 hypothetical protein [Bacteroides sp.]
MKLHKKLNISVTAAALFMAAAVTSCFTGIESTPKITAADVKRQHITVRAEDSYLADIEPEPVGQWEKGKRFYVTDNKFSMLLVPPVPAETDSLAGKEIRFNGYGESADIAGYKTLELDFITPEGNAVTYRTRSTSTTGPDSPLDIPFLIDMDIIDRLKKKMEGKSYYITTASWYDSAMQPVTGRKFVSVTVRRVLPGNQYYSAILELTDDKGKDFNLYMSAGNDIKSLRNFSTLFSLTNPRDAYPQITDATWQNIINSRVAAEMTKEECRMALGSPASVDRQVGYSSIREIWTYENGIYLIFEDNLLRSFRQ